MNTAGVVSWGEWLVFVLHLPKIKWLGTYFRLGPNELSHMTWFATVCQSEFLIDPWLEEILLAFVDETEYTLMCWVVYQFISAGISLRIDIVIIILGLYIFYIIKQTLHSFDLFCCRRVSGVRLPSDLFDWTAVVQMQFVTAPWQNHDSNEIWWKLRQKLMRK